MRLGIGIGDAIAPGRGILEHRRGLSPLAALRFGFAFDERAEAVFEVREDGRRVAGGELFERFAGELDAAEVERLLVVRHKMAQQSVGEVVVRPVEVARELRGARHVGDTRHMCRAVEAGAFARGEGEEGVVQDDAQLCGVAGRGGRGMRWWSCQ